MSPVIFVQLGTSGYSQRLASWGESSSFASSGMETRPAQPPHHPPRVLLLAGRTWHGLTETAPSDISGGQAKMQSEEWQRAGLSCRHSLRERFKPQLPQQHLRVLAGFKSLYRSQRPFPVGQRETLPQHLKAEQPEVVISLQHLQAPKRCQHGPVSPFPHGLRLCGFGKP